MTGMLFCETTKRNKTKNSENYKVRLHENRCKRQHATSAFMAFKSSPELVVNREGDNMIYYVAADSANCSKFNFIGLQNDVCERYP